MKWKIDLSKFSKIHDFIAVVLELKKYLALLKSCKSLIPLAKESWMAASAPLSNLVIEFRKKVAEFEVLAEQTPNKFDDWLIGLIASAADSFLSLFSLLDDYQRMIELDKNVDPS